MMLQNGQVELCQKLPRHSNQALIKSLSSDNSKVWIDVIVAISTSVMLPHVCRVAIGKAVRKSPKDSPFSTAMSRAKLRYMHGVFQEQVVMWSE